MTSSAGIVLEMVGRGLESPVRRGGNVKSLGNVKLVHSLNKNSNGMLKI